MITRTVSRLCASFIILKIPLSPILCSVSFATDCSQKTDNMVFRE